MTTGTEIRELVNQTCAKLGIPSNITIRFNRRFTRRLGDANGKLMRIRFSTPLWARATVEERRQVVIHEVCHIATFLKLGTMGGHGYVWKLHMRLCGVTPDRCHEVNREGLARTNQGSRQVTCACPGKVMTIGATRVRRLLNNANKYSCRRCRTLVKLVTT